MERIELAPGYSISRVLKGGWQLAGGHGDVVAARAIEDMFKFVEAGITTFDCADIYTGVEDLIGAFRAQYRKRFGATGLDGIQVHTKFVPNLDALSAIDRRGVEETIDRSLTRLGVDRLDLVQFHWWDLDVPRYVETAICLADLQRRGKIRLIGLTNFEVAAVRAIVEAGVPIASHQVQYSLLDRRPANGMVEFCQAHGIQLLCYGTVAGGFLSDRYLDAPEPAAPHENRSLTKYHLIIEEFGGWPRFQSLLHTLHGIARTHNVGIAEIAARWTLNRPGVAAAIVGARSAAHIPALKAIAGLTLSADDTRVIERLLASAPGPQGDVYQLERVKGGRHAGIMRYNLNVSR
jgi:aryl-alcohol dehydrogenase-like predicted oxidoreductase